MASNYSKLTDHSLIKAILAADKAGNINARDDAYNILWFRKEKTVERQLHNITWGPADYHNMVVDDVLQDVRTGIYNSLGSYGFKGSFDEWINCVVKSRFIDYGRKISKKRQREVSGDDPVKDQDGEDQGLTILENVPDNKGESDPVEVAINNELRSKLQAILQEHSDTGFKGVKSVKALEWKRDGYTYEEISDKLMLDGGIGRSNYCTRQVIRIIDDDRKEIRKRIKIKYKISNWHEL